MPLSILFLPLVWGSALAQDGQSPPTYPVPPPGRPPVLAIPGARARTPEEMGPYSEAIPGSDVTFPMVPIPGGTFTMGSPPGEEQRRGDEGPPHRVTVSPFWMGRCEVTWDEYHVFMMGLDRTRRQAAGADPEPQDPWADAVSRPTPPYVPMDFDMGVEGYPAVCMTQFAARQYTKWLSMKTGRFYRLPSEAEWEYACRAGTSSAYSFGDDPEDLAAHAWFYDNAGDPYGGYRRVGLKEPNPWGLYDIHGNVAEWVLDAYDPGFYAASLEASGDEPAVDPIHWPTSLYPRVVRGGSWDDDADRLRSAARRKSTPSWKVRDPQLPKSIWYHTDATFVGFRIVRPLVEPPDQERARYWEADVETIREIQERQRRGER